MRNSVLLSAAAHVVIVALALVAFPSPEELPSVPTRALPVELVTIDQVTNLKSTKKVEKPKPVEKPEPPKPEEQEKPKNEPKPEPKPTPPPPEEKAEPIPDKKVEKPKPVEKKKAEKKPAPPKKEPEKKKSFDPNQIAALLDKSPDKAPKSTPLESTEDFEAPATDDPFAAMTMSEIDAVKQRVQSCWNIRDFAGSADADKLTATVKFSLNQDGSLSGIPTIARTSGGSLSRLFGERAVQAVQKCAPYDFLPPDKFTSWRDMRLNFSMSEMM